MIVSNIQHRVMYQPPSHRSHHPNIIFNTGVSTSSPHEKAIVVFHGNASNAADNRFEDLFPERQVYVYEYPGYDFRQGTPNKKQILSEALVFTENVLKKHPDTIIMGVSLGSGIAGFVASSINVPHVILVTPYDAIDSVIAQRYGRVMAFFAHDNFDTIDYLRNNNTPKTVIVALQDKVIPPKHAELLLKNLLNTQVFRLDAEHHTWRHSLNSEQIEYFQNL